MCFFDGFLRLIITQSRIELYYVMSALYVLFNGVFFAQWHLDLCDKHHYYYYKTLSATLPDLDVWSAFDIVTRRSHVIHLLVVFSIFFTKQCDQ
jgi:hypothetical protein